MLQNLKNPPEPFADVIRTHFRLKANTISKQLTDWLNLDDGKSTNSDGAYAGPNATSLIGGSGSVFQGDVQEMKALLRRLADGENIDDSSSS